MKIFTIGVDDESCMSAGLYEANAFAGVCPHVIINRLLAINGVKVRRVEETIKTRLSPGVCPRLHE